MTKGHRLGMRPNSFWRHRGHRLDPGIRCHGSKFLILRVMFVSGAQDASPACLALQCTPGLWGHPAL